jgi:hypothetical protein
MKVNDKVAHLGIIDSLLRFRSPGGVGRCVIWIDADDIETVEVFELDPFYVRELAAEYQMQELLVGGLIGHVNSLVHRNSLCPSRNRRLTIP